LVAEADESRGSHAGARARHDVDADGCGGETAHADPGRLGGNHGGSPAYGLNSGGGLNSSGGLNSGTDLSSGAVAERPFEWSPAPSADPRMANRIDRGRQWETMLSAPVGNLAAEVLANRNLLSAIAGPGIAVTVHAEGGARPVRLTAEDLTRLLVNLVKNAAEAFPMTGGRGHIQISLLERPQGSAAPQALALVIEDNGPGIRPEALGRVFESGFTTHAWNPSANGGWPVAHRGLGLAICRSIVTASGGRITATNREQGGARFEIELPVCIT
jgi:hypothetical protein